VTPASIDVSPAQWAAIAFFIVLAVVALARIPALWRGEVESLAGPTRWNRSLPSYIAAAWTMVIALPPTLYVTSRTGPVSRWAAGALLLALVAVAASFLVASLVWLTGRPEMLVPPRMRQLTREEGRRLGERPYP
jgi:hypothetical protein